MKLIFPADRGFKSAWTKAAPRHLHRKDHKKLHDHRRVLDVMDSFDIDQENFNVLTDWQNGVALVHIPCVTPAKCDRIAKALLRRAFPKSEWHYEPGGLMQDDTHNVLTELIFTRRNHGKTETK